MRTPITERGDISNIAYGFMASQALFAALEIDLFGRLVAGPRTTAALTAATGIPVNRMQTLLHALAGLGLVVARADGYANAPASARYLVRDAPAAFGEYFRLQIAQQIYPAMAHLSGGLTGTDAAFDNLGGLLSVPAEARTFTSAQHAGSLAAARKLVAQIPLTGAGRLLDVAGGSGAFSIAYCARNPGLQATVLDFPAVIDVAREYRDASAVADRIDLLAGDAVQTAWPADQDVVLMSYLLSALGDKEIDAVLAKAHEVLPAGGRLIVHDFMLDDDETGPALASLWFLQYVAYRGDSVSFSGRSLGHRLSAAGFEPEPAVELIPEITKVILARKVAP